MRLPDDRGILLASPEHVGDGIPLAVKDLFDTAGLPTTYGSAIFADHVPAATAEAVRRLEAAGYAIAGKAGLHEFAYGTTSENPHFGDVPNPVARDRVAGGSSGGSAAALAAGLAETALGTDSAGSIRIPAACCGVVGLKPTHGLVPLDGCFPLAPSFDCAGPMARTVAGCTRMMRALVPGFELIDAKRSELEVGVAWVAAADPLVRERVEAAAARFPRRRTIDAPLPAGIYPAFMREVAAVHRELFAEHADLYGEDVRIKVERSLSVSEEEAAAARRARASYADALLAAMDGVDLLVTPTLPCVAPRRARGVAPGDLDVRERLLLFTVPFSALGGPALALPCGSAEDGLPASIQIAGRPGADGLVLAAGAGLEGALASLD